MAGTSPPAAAPAARHREGTLQGLPLADRRRVVGGIDTAVLEGGDGPPAVMLHGAGEFAALWGRVAPDLARTHRLVVPDLPGHGESGTPTDGPLDAERWLAWVADLVDQTCGRPPALVGHLAGGALALRFAVEGGPVERIVLVDSTGLAPGMPAPSFALALAGFLAHPSDRSRDRFVERCMADFDGMRDDLGDRWPSFAGYALDAARRPGARPAMLSLAMAFGTRPVRRRDLARLGVPVSMLWGRHDLQVRVAVAQAASRRFGWPLHVVEDCRDDPCWERPEEAVAALRAALARPARRFEPA
jgi:pimeloyl-ACP methyl ester carboxylesterase